MRLATFDARAVHRRLGETAFMWYKHMCAQSHPWTVDALRADPPAWFLALPDPAKAEIMKTLAGTRIDYPKTCIGAGIHLAFEHMCDVFDMLEWIAAERVVEEAFDHFFSYLYYTVPAVATRSLRTADVARTTWQIVLEAHAAGIPRQSGAQESKVRNSAYL